MAIAMWAMTITLAAVFVAFLCEDLAESPDGETTGSRIEDWQESSFS